jgi:hypothetical protein
MLTYATKKLHNLQRGGVLQKENSAVELNGSGIRQAANISAVGG